MDSPNARRRDAQRSRDRLLDAAGDLLESSGPRFTLPDLARHAGVGVATVYRHFGDLTELLAGYEARAMSRTLTDIKAVEGSDPVVRFRQICQVWVDNSLGQGAPTRFLRSHLGMLQRYHDGDREVQAFVDTLGHTLTELIELGIVPEQDRDAAVLVWVTLFDERTVVDLGRTLGWTGHRVADRLSAAVWGALRGAGVPPAR